MNKNIIFYFSGTGNCLKVAKDIAEALPNCEVVSMGGNNSYSFQGEYDSIGFVYPTYFVGLPLKVGQFVGGLNFENTGSSYVYAITTCGGTAGNALAQMASLLENKGVNLSYGEKLLMFSNYIVLYNMGTNVEEKSASAQKALAPIITHIKSKQIKKVRKPNPILEYYYKQITKSIYNKDMHYNVSDQCISCGICKDVCPVGNIKLEQNKPVFQHHCEQCMACIQYCPKRAINYKNSTQKRRRYTNPSINSKELAKCNKGK